MASPVRITFLGGLGEIGRNCAALEQDGQIVLLDCGLMFPEADMPGIDLVLPDFTWLHENADRIDGCILTHGHEDHIGALGFLLRDMSFPIYGSALSLGLAKNRIDQPPIDVDDLEDPHQPDHGDAAKVREAADRRRETGRAADGGLRLRAQRPRALEIVPVPDHVPRQLLPGLVGHALL